MLSVLTLERMAVRTITITHAAYERLAAQKRPGESFTDVVLRLTRGATLRDLPDIVSPAEARALAEAVLQARDERRDARRRRG